MDGWMDGWNMGLSKNFSVESGGDKGGQKGLSRNCSHDVVSPSLRSTITFHASTLSHFFCSIVICN